MTDYNKLWSALLGAVAGLVAAYGLVPDAFADSWPMLTTSLIPVLGGLLGTVLGPKNTN
jgi:hypothetical protein